MTGNQEYGWDGENGTLKLRNEKCHKPIRSTAITGYVENYYLTKGVNPFKVKER